MYDRIHRDPRVTEFYKSMSWRRIRIFVLRRDHELCVRCYKQQRITKATIVHHIVELDPNDEHAWSLRLVPTNLESVCQACHNAEHKTAKK